MKETGFRNRKKQEKTCDPLPGKLSKEPDMRRIPAGGGIGEMEQRPGLLLHSCCGPCSTSVIEQLASEYLLTVFYYNPCITDENEYIRRMESQKLFIEKYNEKNPLLDPVRFIEGKYQPLSFMKLTKGLEDEPEGGQRCTLCFKQRLEKTAETAKMHGFDYFTTTLSVSPHKDRKKISEIGNNIALKYGLSFLDRDFKKKDGFKRSIEMSKEYGLYRQDYCGCEFSKR